MKKLIPFLALAVIAIVFAACHSNSANDLNAASDVNRNDTAGLAQFQAWKAQNELTPVSQYPGNLSGATVKKTIVYYVPVKSTHHKTVSRSYNSGSYSSASSNTALRKRGWSSAAKGAAIGAGGGAILGAVINRRNPLVGGVIGGLLGGAGGYVYGHSRDKRNGRY